MNEINNERMTMMSSFGLLTLTTTQELEKPPKKEWNRPSPSRPGFLEARLVVKQGAGISLEIPVEAPQAD